MRGGRFGQGGGCCGSGRHIVGGSGGVFVPVHLVPATLGLSARGAVRANAVGAGSCGSRGMTREKIRGITYDTNRETIRWLHVAQHMIFIHAERQVERHVQIQRIGRLWYGERAQKP